MNQLNSLILEGNLVKDAELIEPVEGFKVCKFALGVNRWFKNKSNEGVEEVSFFEVEVYGKTAEFCQKKGVKGREVRIVGHLKQNTWKDENGKTMSKVVVIAEHIEYKPVFSKKGEQTLPENQVNVSVQVEKEATVF